MTRRDLQWKAGGFALMAVSCALCMAVDGSPLMLLFFPLVLLGLPLMIHGKRVGQMVRAERRGHSHTVDAVHAARRRRRGQGRDGFGR
ncbi:hypothetical protein QP175_05360 [Sphingomonas aerolata]|uniref:hypothetical protein n=1 Tax=Sphingomonas aerolata TaxID=185951 RepID=UPI002FE287BB